jgi:hypothetical protein
MVNLEGWINVKIFITAPGRFSGDKLKVGVTYNVEIATEGTEAQNKTFHALVQCYWTSGAHSYNARSYKHFRALIKLYLGAGMEKFYNLANTDGTPCPGGRLDYRLKSWADYKKKERQMTIDNLICEMMQVGVDNPRFWEILNGMDSKDAERIREKSGHE